MSQPISRILYCLKLKA